MTVGIMKKPWYCAFKNNRIANYDYEPSPYSELIKVFTEFPFANNNHLLDYGCGKSRVLITAALFDCARVTGVEINRDMYRIAESSIT